ncbi:MAG: response regulator [Butyrivibrio sp.]|nr:response regulator [Acetatifactor muris]MCM1561191.1 response regulator [Butyrivibrio sp.]
MEKRVCKVGICDDRAEDIERINAALIKGLKEIGQPLKLLYRSFQSGGELYEAACRDSFDLLFLDIEMPGMNGFELAEKLCRECPGTYLVFVSAYENLVFNVFEYDSIWFVRKGNLEEELKGCDFFAHS